MWLILFNNHVFLEPMIDFFKKEILIDDKLQSNSGKSHLHLIVMPNDFGWINNHKLLRTFLENGIGNFEILNNEG